MAWESIPMLSDFVEIAIVYLPRVFLAIIVLALGWIMGRLVGFLLNNLIGKMGWESAFRRTSVGRAILRSGYTSGSFFAALVKGFVYLFAVSSALNLLSIPFLTASVQAFLEYLPNLVEGVLILLVGLVFSDWVGESIEKGSFSTVQSYLLGGLVRVLLYFVSITIGLAQMKIDITILYIFAQAFAWSLAIAIGIAFGWYLRDKVGPWLDKILIHETKETKGTT